MTFKSALNVAFIALIATTSSLAMAAPSEAKDGCGRRFKFSNRHGQCVLKNKFRGNYQAPVVIRPTIRPIIHPVVVRPAFRPVIRPVVVRPMIQPIIHHVVQPGLDAYPPTFAQPSIHNPYIQVAY